MNSGHPGSAGSTADTAHPLASRRTRTALNRRLAVLGVPAKACGACLAVLGLASFPVHQSGLQGRLSRCKACHRAGQATRRRDPAYRAAERSQQRPYDRQRAQTDDRRAYMLDRSRLRRALEAGAEYDGHQPEDIYLHWDDEGYYACIACGGPFEHLDHNVPLIRGGSHTLDNLVPLCESCNTSKQGKCPYRFYAERFPALRPWLEPFFDVHERLTDEELAERGASIESPTWRDSIESATVYSSARRKGLTMKREAYKGRKIKVVAGRGANYGFTRITLNGVDMGKWLQSEDEALRSTRSTIDHADEVGASSGRYGAEWYAPGSYELCDEGHAKEIGGECGHHWCVAQRAETAQEAITAPSVDGSYTKPSADVNGTLKRFKIDLQTATGWEEFTVYAATPQEAEIKAGALYLLQEPKATIHRALRSGSMTSAPNARPEGVTWA